MDQDSVQEPLLDREAAAENEDEIHRPDIDVTVHYEPQHDPAATELPAGMLLDGPLGLEPGPDIQVQGDYQQQTVEEADLYRMKELIQENPHDVIQYIESEGVLKLGQFDVQDFLVLKGMGSDNMLTHGTDHLDVDWEAMWRELLSKVGQTIAGTQAQPGWSKLCAVEAHVVTIRDAAADGPKGLLQPLLKRYQARACTLSVFGLPAVQAVINWKWRTWARRFLLYELAIYLLWLLSYTAFTLLYEYEEEEESLMQLLSTPVGTATVACNVVALAAMLPFLYMEVCTVLAYNTGWVNLWNILDIVSYMVQFTISIVHLQRQFLDESTFPILLSVQHILLWAKLHYFARVLTPNKNLLTDTLRIVIGDLSWFLMFMGLTMLGFAFAFYSLFRQDRDASGDFTNFWHAIASQFSYLLAMFDFNIFYNSTNPASTFILFIIYEFVMYIMLLNIMIAIMTAAFNKIGQDEHLRFMCSKGLIIDELEATLPSWLKRRSWFPAFVHVLKVDPSSTFESTSLSKIMSGIGAMESNLLAAQQSMRLRMEAVEAKIADAHAKVVATANLLDGLLAAAPATMDHTR